MSQNNKIIFSYRDKIKIINIFIYCLIIVFTISLLNNKIEWKLLIWIHPFILFITYLERNSAVNISFYRKGITVNFYLLLKKINLNYNEIIYFRNCWGRYSGKFIRFKAIHNGKVIYFNIKTSDDDLRKFISDNFVNYENLKK